MSSIFRIVDNKPLELTPKPSLMCRNYILVIHSLALIAAIANALPIPVRAALFLIICINLRISLQAYVFKPQAYAVKYSETTQWQLAFAGHDYISVRLLGSSVSTPYFVLLHFAHKKKKYHQLIFEDALSADDFRQLRVRLKISTS